MNLNESTTIFVRRCTNIRQNNFWFYRVIIPDFSYVASFVCLFYILKICNYREANAPGEMLNGNCYLIQQQNPILIFTNSVESGSFRPEREENCLESIESFFLRR